jgi:hypothetical protein
LAKRLVVEALLTFALRFDHRQPRMQRARAVGLRRVRPTPSP